jgi:hypothetical protein
MAPANLVPSWREVKSSRGIVTGRDRVDQEILANLARIIYNKFRSS